MKKRAPAVLNFLATVNVTHKRVAAVVISTWVLSAIISSMYYWNLGNIFTVITVIVSTASIPTTAIFNFKICVAIRRHAHQIQAL